MGTFNVAIQIGDLAGQHFVDVQALVDTGSTYTVCYPRTYSINLV